MSASNNVKLLLPVQQIRQASKYISNRATALNMVLMRTTHSPRKMQRVLTPLFLYKYIYDTQLSASVFRNIPRCTRSSAQMNHSHTYLHKINNKDCE